MQDLTNYERRGYLHSDFRLFHLKDTSMERIDWHFHEFHKVILFLSGQAAYSVEGRHYRLLPGDLVVIARGCIHRPEIEGEMPYERIILYISADYLQKISIPDCALSRCFSQTREQGSFVLRLSERMDDYVRCLSALEHAMSDREYGASLLRQSLFLQFMVCLNRDSMQSRLSYVEAASCDEKILSILQYLNVHLSEPISIDALSQQFYLSKYHMMRRFRTETGCTIHGYLTEKRLQLAMELLSQGQGAQAVCLQCGFQDYSAFSRAFRRRYHVTPGTIRSKMHDAT